MSVEVYSPLELSPDTRAVYADPSPAVVNPGHVELFVGKINSIAHSQDIQPPQFEGTPEEIYHSLCSAASVALSEKPVRRRDTDASLIYNRLVRYLGGNSAKVIGAQENPPVTNNVVNGSLGRLASSIALGAERKKRNTAARPKTKGDDFITNILATVTPGIHVSDLAEFRTGAPCTATENPDIFLSTELGERREAIAICNQCPVLDSCLTFTIHSPVLESGVVAGLSETRRRQIRAELAKRNTAGTTASQESA